MTDNETWDLDPDISGTNVVWENEGGGIYSNFVGRLGDGLSPHVSGTNVVWSGSDGSDWEIYSDFAGQLTNNTIWDGEPDISGTNVVWEGWDGPDSTSWQSNIYSNFAGQLTNDGTHNSMPAISGTNVVWMHDDGSGEYEIYSNFAGQLSSNSTHNWWPAISGTNVVWHGWDGHDFEIFSNFAGQLTDNSRDDWGAAVSGTNVAWRGWDGHDVEIYSNFAGQVTNNDTDDGDDMVSISGMNVVWHGSDGSDSEIYLAQPGNVYGLFVGANDALIAGGADALSLRDAMDSALHLTDSEVLTADLSAGHSISYADMSDVLNSWDIQPGDQLVVYFSAHGASSNLLTDETTLTPGDEYLNLGTRFHDDDLSMLLDGLEGVNKWVLLDACYSGGFWGDNNPGDMGDLEKLSDVALLAACWEDAITGYDDTDGRGYFTDALIDAFTLDGGFAKADVDHVSGVTFDELTSWVLIYGEDLDVPFIREKAYGDLIPWSPDLWNPFSVTSDGFLGSLFGAYSESTEVIPAPGAALLCGLGAGLVGWLRKRRTL